MAQQYKTNFGKRFQIFPAFKKTSIRVSEQLPSGINKELIASFSTLIRFFRLLVYVVMEVSFSRGTNLNELNQYCKISMSGLPSMSPVSAFAVPTAINPSNVYPWSTSYLFRLAVKLNHII